MTSPAESPSSILSYAHPERRRIRSGLLLGFSSLLLFLMASGCYGVIHIAIANQGSGRVPSIRFVYSLMASAMGLAALGVICALGGLRCARTVAARIPAWTGLMLNSVIVV